MSCAEFVPLMRKILVSAHFNYVNTDIGGYIKTGFNPYYGVTVPICDVGISIQNQTPTADAVK